MIVNFLDAPGPKCFDNDEQKRPIRAIEFLCPHGEVIILYVTAGPAFHLNSNPDLNPKAWHYEISNGQVSIDPSIDLTKSGHPAECHFFIKDAKYTEFYDEDLNNNMLQNATMSQVTENNPGDSTSTAGTPANMEVPTTNDAPGPENQNPNDDSKVKEIEIDCSSDVHFSETDRDGKIAYAIKNFKIKPSQDNPHKVIVSAEFAGDEQKARAYIINQSARIISGLFKGCKILQS